MLRMKRRNQSILQVLLFAGILVAINVLGNYFYTYLDLTEEKKYTLTRPTKDLLASIDDVVYVKVLLDGKFPAGFKRLQSATLEMLKDFRAASAYIEFEFDDPMRGIPTQREKRQVELEKDGIRPTQVTFKDADGSSKRNIYPWAVLTYKGRTYNVNLLENEQIGVNPEVVLNNSVALLEYKFANAIQKLKTKEKPNIVFVEGHGELAPQEVFDLERTLNQYYDTKHVNLDSLINIPVETISALVIARPRGPFSQKDKFKIDQYVMNGGKVLWLIDRLAVSVDSIGRNLRYVPYAYQLELEDLLFKYGIRINPNMVLDLRCSPIPLTTGQVGNRPQLELFPYPYYPVVAATSAHPIVKSLDLVSFEFPASIDLEVKTKTDIQKTVLLASSDKSRLQFTPATLEFKSLSTPPDPNNFNQPYQPMAVLYEGVFPSLYANRVTPEMEAGMRELGIDIKKESSTTRMIVVADGDVAKNPIIQGQPYPLGFNRFDRYTYANRDFLLNAIEYLIDENGIIEARGKDVKLRLLDVNKAKAERTKWQLINIGIPIVFLILFGIAFNFIRRRRYAQ